MIECFEDLNNKNNSKTIKYKYDDTINTNQQL